MMTKTTELVFQYPNLYFQAPLTRQQLHHDENGCFLIHVLLLLFLFFLILEIFNDFSNYLSYI